MQIGVPGGGVEAVIGKLKFSENCLGSVGKTMTSLLFLKKLVVKTNIPSSKPYPELESPTKVCRVRGVHWPEKGSLVEPVEKYPSSTKSPSPFPRTPALNRFPLASMSKSGEFDEVTVPHTMVI